MKYIVALLTILVFAVLRVDAQVVVIVHKSVNISAMNAAQIADILTLSTRTWPSGEKIVVFDQKGESARKAFFDFIGKSPMDVRKKWLRSQLSGEGKAPETLDSDDEVIQRVASTPGAIGYVSAGKAKGNVKVIATID